MAWPTWPTSAASSPASQSAWSAARWVAPASWRGERLGLISAIVDRALNRTALGSTPPASESALALHRRSPVVDLVVGTALFRTTFVERSRRGHVDLPRLRAAGVNVIGLTVATRFPDLRGRLSAVHFNSLGLPAAASVSDIAIAEWAIGRIRRWSELAGGRMRLLMTGPDLTAALAGDGPLGVFIGIQGGHALGGDLANVERLRRQGVLMLAPAHVMDNALVGSSTGRRAGGLTGYGREVIAALQQAGMVVDLAHMSLAGIEQALPLMRGPFAISHTGLLEEAGGRSRWRRYSAGTRNLPASLVGEVAAAGGLVGIVLATKLLGGGTLAHACTTIERAVLAAGARQVAIGSDMDGALRTVIDAAGWPALTGALLERGMDGAAVAGVIGGNAARLLKAALGREGHPRAAIEEATRSGPPEGYSAHVM